MADDNYMHTAEIMKAALPYVDVQTKTTMEFMYKLFDFMGSFKNLTKPINMAACGFQNPKINIEGLLNGIRPLCSSKERELVDRILNIFNIKRMYETYNNYMSVLKTMPGFEGSPFGASDLNNESSPFNFNGFDFSTLFNSMNNSGVDLSSLMGGLSNFAKNSPPPEPGEAANFSASAASAAADASSAYTASDAFTAYTASAASVASDSVPKEHTDMFTENTSEQNQKSSTAEEAGNGASSDSSYNNILNMLKSMIPPEQKESYENLSMLFKDKSYDDNNKSV